MTDYKIAPLTWLRTKFAELNHTHNEYVNPTIVDDLTSDDNTKVLSAKQGKVLKTSLDGKADSLHNHDDRYYTESEVVDFLNKKIDLDCEFIDGWWTPNNTYSLKGNSVKDSNTLRNDGKKFIYKVPDFSDMYYDDTELYLSIVTTSWAYGIGGKIYYNENTIYVEDAKTLFMNKYLLIEYYKDGNFDKYRVLDIFNIFHNHNDVYYSKSEVDNKIITDVSGLTDNQGLLFSGDYDDLTDKPNIPSSSSDLTDGSNIIKKSSTNGLIKNDGSIDTNIYLTSSSLNGYQTKNNLVTSFSQSTSDTKYPSEKCIFDRYDNFKEEKIIYEFSSIDNQINEMFFKDDVISFNMNLSDYLNSDCYINIGNNSNDYITFGVINTSFHLEDGLSGDDWTFSVPLETSADIEIIYPNVDINQDGNTGEVGDVYDYDITVNVNSTEHKFSTNYTISANDDIALFNRNVIKNVYEDENGMITNLKYSKLLYEEVPITFTYEDDSTETIIMLRKIR